MFKKIMVVLVCLAMITAVFAGCGSASKDNGDANKKEEQKDDSQKKEPEKKEKIIVKVGYENNPDEPVDKTAKEWARLVDERSNGTIELQLFPSSQLGSKKDLTEQMIMGGNVLTITDGSFLMDYVPDFGIISGPFLADTYDQYFKLTESDWFKEQVKLLEEKGLTVVTAKWIYGTRHMISTKPVKSPEDMAGLKIRCPNNELFIKTIEAMGGTPTPMPWGEAYPALAQGVINGVENPLPVLYGAKMYESAKYLSLTGHIKMISMWIGSAEFFKSIPEDAVELIMQAGDDSGTFINESIAAADNQTIEDLKKEGVEVLEVDTELFRKAVRPVYDSFPQWSEGLYDTVQEAMK